MRAVPVPVVMVLSLLALLAASASARGLLQDEFGVGLWTCRAGWDVAGRDAPNGYLTGVKSLKDCHDAMCPRGAGAEWFCFGDFVVYDKDTKECWFKTKWDCGPDGETKRVPSKVACRRSPFAPSCP